MVNLQSPSTWPRYGVIDRELEHILHLNSTPRFDKDNIVANIPIVRAKWAPLYEQFADAAFAKASKSVERESLSVPRRDGSSARCLLYRPTSPSQSQCPLLVLFHGGGWCFGSPEMEVINCIRAVMEFGVVAVSVEYRLAPEFPFPYAIQDSWDVLKWISNNASLLGVKPSLGFVLGGTSAGGNISAVLSHLARDSEMTPPLTGIYLNAPAVLSPSAVSRALKRCYVSRQQNKNAPVLNEDAMNMYEKAYAPDQESHLWNPFNWPTGHSRLPPHYFQICGLDILRDEGLMYAQELKTSGVLPVKVDIYPGLPHAFWANFPTHSRHIPEVHTFLKTPSRVLVGSLGINHTSKKAKPARKVRFVLSLRSTEQWGQSSDHYGATHHWTLARLVSDEPLHSFKHQLKTSHI